MKRIVTTIILAAAAASNALAHHLSNSDMAGLNIVEWSPHLLMTF